MNISYEPDLSRFDIEDHTADVWLSSSEKGLEDLLLGMIEGLYGIMADRYELEMRGVDVLHFKDEELSNLLIDLLSELLFLFDAETILIMDPKIIINRTGKNWELRLEFRFYEYTIPEGSQGMEVKAITYHGAKLEKRDGRWKGRVLVDI